MSVVNRPSPVDYLLHWAVWRITVVYIRRDENDLTRVPRCPISPLTLTYICAQTERFHRRAVVSIFVDNGDYLSLSNETRIRCRAKKLVVLKTKKKMLCWTHVAKARESDRDDPVVTVDGGN